MFNNQRYLAKGVQTEIPIPLQLFMWGCIDRLPKERDYFQVFKLENLNGIQKITHFSEQPEYRKEYIITIDTPITTLELVDQICELAVLMDDDGISKIS